MKKSKSIKLKFVVACASAALMFGCDRQINTSAVCVDQTNKTVDEYHCKDNTSPMFHFYHWYNYSYYDNDPPVIVYGNTLPYVPYGRTFNYYSYSGPGSSGFRSSSHYDTDSSFSSTSRGGFGSSFHGGVGE